MTFRNPGSLFAALLAILAVGAAPLQRSSKRDPQAASPPKVAGAKTTGTSAGDAAKGKQLFQANCAVCHEAASEEVRVGPGLKGFFKKPSGKLSDGKVLAHTADGVRQFIIKGNANMPPLGKVLSEKDISDLMAYLQRL